MNYFLKNTGKKVLYFKNKNRQLFHNLDCSNHNNSKKQLIELFEYDFRFGAMAATCFFVYLFQTYTIVLTGVRYWEGTPRAPFRGINITQYGKELVH